MTYPTQYEVKAGPYGEAEERTFKYITYTGSTWAQPIGEARFEYCDDPAKGLIEHGQKWTPTSWWCSSVFP